MEYLNCKAKLKRQISLIQKSNKHFFTTLTDFLLTEKEIKDALKDRDDWDRVCVSDKFEFIDQKLQDSFQDDLFFPDDMLEKGFRP